MSQSMSFLYFYDIVVLVIEIIGGLNTCRPTEKEYLTVNPPTPPQTYSLYHSLMMKMKLILLATLASLALGAIPLSLARVLMLMIIFLMIELSEYLPLETTGGSSPMETRTSWRHTICLTRKW